MRDYILVGSTPCDEPCEQLGATYDDAKARAEVRAYCAQLGRQFGECDRITFRIKGEGHDFGTYYEVAIYYDNADDVASEQAYQVEAELPLQFDAEARQMLAATLAGMMTEAR